MTGQRDDTSGAEQEPVQLTARIMSEGSRFVATVEGIELEGSGNTPDAAQRALIQTMRGWLERLDTSGKLGDALGVERLGEETEIVLQFVDGDDQDGYGG